MFLFKVGWLVGFIIVFMLNINRKDPFDMLHKLRGWHNRMYTCFQK